MREVDTWPVIVASGVKSSPDDPLGPERLKQYAKQFCTPNMVAFLFENEGRLRSLIDKAWSWESVDHAVSVGGQHRLALFSQALSAPCVCHGAWRVTVEHALHHNELPVTQICHDVLYALEHGRGANVPVVFVGHVGGEGILY